jgi:flavodoxin
VARALGERWTIKAVIVYESLWGNTARIASAIAEGIGPVAEAMSTGEATPDVIAGADLIVAGSPVFAFKMSSDQMRETIRKNPGPAPAPPDLSHPAMASWLESLPAGNAAAAAFDTEARGPFGKAAPTIARSLEASGYRLIGKPTGFYVSGKYGPLRDGELDRAREWGRELAAALAVR